MEQKALFERTVSRAGKEKKLPGKRENCRSLIRAREGVKDTGEKICPLRYSSLKNQSVSEHCYESDFNFLRDLKLTLQCAS
jgi:hypothetical protein